MDTDSLQRLADLAGLDLDPAEREGLAADLARLDVWVDQLPRLPDDAPSRTGIGPPRESVPPCPLSEVPQPGSLLEVPPVAAPPTAEPAP